MLDLNVVSEFVYENFEKVKQSESGNHFLARCIFCGDSKKNAYKKRFNLNYNNGNPIYHCFNCDKSGSFIKLYSEIKNISISDTKKILYGFDSNYLINKLSNKKTRHVEQIRGNELCNYILDDCINEDRKIESFLSDLWLEVLDDFKEERGIPDKYKIFYAYKGDYKGRIVIPIYDKYKNITYFQARRVPKSKILPKYKNPAVEKGTSIFNKYQFNKNKDIIVFEGILDAMMIGNQGTCCLGSYINDDYISQIINLTSKSIIIALDNDEPGYISLRKFMKESKFSKKVKYFFMPKIYNDCNDINKCVVKNNLKDVYKFIICNSFSYVSAYSHIHMEKLGELNVYNKDRI